MAVGTQQQQATEAQINTISEAIIKLTPFGQYYQYMKAASQLGEGMLPHKFCTDKDGKTVKVYKGDFSKIVGSFIKPVHEQAAQSFSQGQYGRGIVDLMGFGGFWNLHEQKTAQCFEVRPDQLINTVKTFVKTNIENGNIKTETASNGKLIRLQISKTITRQTTPRLKPLAKTSNFSFAGLLLIGGTFILLNKN